MTERTRGEGSQASVEIHDVEPVNPPRAGSSEVFLAEQEGRVVKSVDRAVGEDDTPVTTTHTRPGTIVMYKPTGNGYVPKTVSVSALRMLLGQGWREVCPDCGKQHVNAQGVISTDPNLCSARDPVAVRICPVCRKRIYDNVRFPETVEQETDVNVIQDDPYDKSTGASRTAALLNLHLWVRHPRQAQMMNVPPLPAAMRDMIEEPKPV